MAQPAPVIINKVSAPVGWDGDWHGHGWHGHGWHHGWHHGWYDDWHHHHHDDDRFRRSRGCDMQMPRWQGLPRSCCNTCQRDFSNCCCRDRHGDRRGVADALLLSRFNRFDGFGHGFGFGPGFGFASGAAAGLAATGAHGGHGKKCC